MNVYLDYYQDYSPQELKNFFSKVFQEEDFFKNKSKLLLKPNLLQASPPEKAITTHPLFVEGAILAIREIAPHIELFLGDSPGANFINFDKVLEKTGMFEVCNKYNVKTVKFEKFNPKNKNGHILNSFIDMVDGIVNLAKLKTHALTGLTLAVKNFFGLVPGTNKVVYHRKYPDNKELAASIFDVYSQVKGKTISFLDGILVHEGEGPSRGTPKFLGVVAASKEAELIDFVITDMLGLPVDFCKTNLIPLKNGLQVNHINIIGQKKRLDKIKLPISARVDFLPYFLKKWFASQIFVKPEIEKNRCIKCNLCYKSCPVNAIFYTRDKFLEVDKGKCIECFCCYEVCESDAIKLKRSFLHRVVIR